MEIMNVKKNATIGMLVLICSALLLVGKALAVNPPANADELVAQHLDSIASPAVRAGLKTRVVQGPVEFRILVGGAGVLDGKAFLVSEGEKFQFMMKLPNNVYRGEQFVFDGKNDMVAFSGAQQTRSPVGNFVFVQDAVVREGLLGGTLSMAWPLLDLKDRKADLSFDGLKKVDGQELYELRYRPRKKSDLEISLYFDPQTLHHVETVYSYTSSESFANLAPSTAVGNAPSPGSVLSPDVNGSPSSQGAGGTAETSAARRLPNRYRLTEKFSDFKTTDGVTLPTHEDIQFSQELQNGRTMLWDWDLKGLEVANNMGVDAKNFEVK
jgi:hypothetical protein